MYSPYGEFIPLSCGPPEIFNSVCLMFQQISKWEVDTFKPGHRVPACQLLLKWGGVQEQPVELMYRINLLGAKEPFNYTLIFLPELHPPLQG